MIKIRENNLNKIIRGQTIINKVYLGNILIYINSDANSIYEAYKLRVELDGGNLILSKNEMIEIIEKLLI